MIKIILIKAHLNILALRSILLWSQDNLKSSLSQSFNKDYQLLLTTIFQVEKMKTLKQELICKVLIPKQQI
jgi:hypothetical protein